MRVLGLIPAIVYMPTLLRYASGLRACPRVIRHLAAQHGCGNAQQKRKSMSRIPLPADQDIPAASRPVLEATEKQLGFTPNMLRALALSPAVLNGWSDLQTALSRTLDATTRHGIAHAVTEVNGCRYCKAIHTFTATAFGRIPAEEQELFRQGRASDPKRSAAVAFAKKVIETHGKVSDADLNAVRQAGYKDSQILEIVALAVQYSMTNFLNNVMDTDVDIPTPSAA